MLRLLILWIALACELGAQELAANRWTAPGGGADGVGVALVAPVADEPALAWSFGPLAFEGEPLVWRERVVLGGRDPSGRRALVVLDLASGRLLSRTLFAATEPLAIAVWNDRIAVRVASTRVEVFTWRSGRLLAERQIAAPGPISAPLLIEDELYLREGDTLARYDMAQREATWRSAVSGVFRGTPALRGGQLFALCYDDQGRAHLMALERDTGNALDDVVLGRHSGAAVPGASEACELVVHAGHVFLRPALPFPSTEGIEFSWARVFRDGERLRPGTSLHAFLAPPLETPRGWIAPERTVEGGTRWIFAQQDGERERALELAAESHHAWLCAARKAASRAGGIAYLGPAAIELETLDVRWRRARVPDARAVPIDHGLLVIEGDVLRCLTRAPRPRTRAEERAEQWAVSLDRTQGERIAQLASLATRSGDLALAQLYLEEAERLGAQGRALAVTRGELERLQQSSRPQPLDPRRRAAVLEEERAVHARWPAEFANAARGADPAYARALLRELFERAPGEPAGLDVLGRLLPAPLEPLPHQATSWLDYLDIGARIPLQIVDAPLDGGATSRTATRLLEERASWREDALGYASPRLFVVAAGAAPGAIAHVLQAGELVCSVLESTFAGRALATSDPLELVLYPTREEYLAHSGSDLGGLETVLGWTAGHYDLSADLSRMFLPEDDRRHQRLLGVYAHELTHHWLATRSSFGPPRGTPDTPGFWIVEGIATWAEELALDPESGTWSAENPRAASLDTLANVDASALVPWARFLSLSFDGYRQLETRPTTRASLSWQLGMHAARSPMQLFYAQGGVLAHYLFRADEGRYRPLLLSAVESFYRGEPLDLPHAMGLSAEELGARVAAFAREAIGP